MYRIRSIITTAVLSEGERKKEIQRTRREKGSRLVKTQHWIRDDDCDLDEFFLHFLFYLLQRRHFSRQRLLLPDYLSQFFRPSSTTTVFLPPFLSVYVVKCDDPRTKKHRSFQLIHYYQRFRLNNFIEGVF